MHTPASVAGYSSLITGVPWSASAHAKDIWTSDPHDLAQKLDAAQWTVTCTQGGAEYLRSLAKNPDRVHLSYHGLDLARFPPSNAHRSVLDGSADEVTVLSVGRAVPKKGLDILLRALAALERPLAWRFVHIGSGGEQQSLMALADQFGIATQCTWKGSMTQTAVLHASRPADVLALACRLTDDGDRDGLPNVLVEAASQGLAVVSTTVSAIPELFTDAQTALLVPPEDVSALAGALDRAIRDPALRFQLGQAAEARVRADFDFRSSVSFLAAQFRSGRCAE